MHIAGKSSAQAFHAPIGDQRHCLPALRQRRSQRAAGLPLMPAVGKPAATEMRRQFREASVQRIRNDFAQFETAHTRRIDQIAAARQVIERAGGCGVGTMAGGLGDGLDADLAFR